MPPIANRFTNQIAERFIAARRNGTGLADYPGPLPATMAEAYAIQDRAMALIGHQVAGWKVGKIAPPVEGFDRLAGPIFANSVFAAREEPVEMPIFADGFGAAEGEFLLRIGTAPDPAKMTYTIEEALAHIDAVHVGMEIASSPFAGINSHGPRVTISDFGNNNGLVVGAPIAGWQDVDLLGWQVQVLINDEPIGSATAATMLDGPFGAARFLFELMAARGISLTAGQWISSGAVTGVHPVSVGDRVEARFDGTHTVTCRIVAQA